MNVVVSHLSLNLILLNSIEMTLVKYFLEESWLTLFKVDKLPAQALFLALFYPIDKLDSFKIIEVFLALFLCTLTLVDNLANLMPHLGCHVSFVTSRFWTLTRVSNCALVTFMERVNLMSRFSLV